MSDYILGFTGAQLDDAINKVRSGFILPSGESPVITTNGTHPVREFENAVVNVPIPAGYLIPTGKPATITANGNDIDIAKYAKIDVNVPVPSGYISPEGLLIHCKNTAKGTFSGTGQTCDKLSIGLSFRPKIMLIIATSPITTSNTGSPYEICAVWRVCNDSYAKLQDNCVFTYKSGSNTKTGHTDSNGLRGNADNTITGWGTSAKFASGTTYSWYAWG